MIRNFKDKVREQFGRTADGYVRNKGFSQGEDLAEAVRLLKPTQDDVMLDVACGGGHTALYFAPYVRSVVASDLTMQMLKKAQEYISEEGGIENVTFREADAEDLPFPSGAFTILTCRVAPHHFPDVPRALKEFHRVLRRKEGRLVIVDTLLPEDEEIADFFQKVEKTRDATHVQSYRQDEWVQMVNDAGFDVRETRVVPKTHEFQEWAKRTGMSREAVQQLNRTFIDASAKIQDYFKLETFAGEVESFTDQKILIFATRRDIK